VSPTSKVDEPPPPRRGLKISGWTLFALSLGFGVWTSAELAIGELNQGARNNLLASIPGARPELARRPARGPRAAGAAANHRAIVAGSLGAASFVTGVTLLAVDAHRRKKQRRLALVPVTGPIFGARLRLEF
jgi:hypothetical protein